MTLLTTSDTYYELLDKRIPGHGEDLEALRQRNILVDGTPSELLLQIFSENQLGPIFSSSFSARATKVSAKATSRLCSKPWSWTRCAVAC